MADDRDIKIYVKKSVSETTEFKSLTDEIQLHISNGNREKAIALGESLAKVKPEDNVVDLSGFNMTAALLYQIRVLLTFVAEYRIQHKLPVEFLADTASSAMYDYFKANESGYYDNISDGGAFTFYLLALKKGGDVAENIGEQFAKLCNISWQEIADLGKRVFTDASQFFDSMIDEVTFEEV